MSLKNIACALTFAAFSSISHAIPLTFSFEGFPNNTVIGSHFYSWGVLFDNASVVRAPSVYGVDGSNIIRNTSGSIGLIRPSNPITAFFTSAVTSVSLDGLEVGSNGFRLTAYDSMFGGSVVDTKQVIGRTLAGYGEAYTLSVTGANIMRVEFSQVNSLNTDYMFFDKFTFDRAMTTVEPQPVPEPGSFALFGSAALGLWGVSRRQRLMGRR